MLAIARRPGEAVTVFLPDGRSFEIIYERKSENVGRLIFDAPQDVKIMRNELLPMREEP